MILHSSIEFMNYHKVFFLRVGNGRRYSLVNGIHGGARLCCQSPGET